MVGDFYASFMDEARAEQLGLEPLAPEFARIAAIEDRAGLLDYLAHAGRVGHRQPDRVRASCRTPSGPTSTPFWLGQSGLAMPDRDYYLKDDARFAEMRAQVPGLRDRRADDGGPQGRRGRRQARHGVRDPAREGVLAAGATCAIRRRPTTRSTSRARRKAYAGLRLGPLLRRVSASQDHDQLIVGQPSYFADVGKALRRRAARDLEGLPAGARRSTPTRPTSTTRWCSSTSSSTAARSPARRSSSRAGSAASTRPRARSATCSARPTSRSTSRRRRSSAWTSWSRTCSKAFGSSIDELEWMSPETRREAHAKLAAFTREDRLPGEVAGLHRASRCSRDDLVGNVMRAREVEHEARARQARPAGRPQRVVHDAADGQRLLQPARQRDRVPGRDPAAAVLRPERRRRRELRRHRRGDRPRDQPRLRRPGPQVRRQGRAARLVDGARTTSASRRAPTRLVAQYTAFSPLPGHARQRRAHARREHRRPGGRRRRLQGLPPLARRRSRRRCSTASPATSASSSAGRRCGRASTATTSCASGCSPTRTARASTAANGIVRNMPQFEQAFGVKAGDGLYLPPGPAGPDLVMSVAGGGRVW